MVSYIGTLIGAFITIFIYPYFLSLELIGLTRIMVDSAVFFAFFAQFGLSNAIIKHYSALQKGEEKDQLIWFISLFPIFTFGLCFAIFMIFREPFIHLFAAKSPLFVKYVMYVLPLAFFMMYQYIFETYASTFHRITIPKLIREIGIRILMIASIVTFALLHLNVNNYILFIVLTYIAAVVLNIGYLVFGLKVKFSSFKPKIIYGVLLKKMIGFMLFMVLGGIGANVITRIDVFMLGSMSGLAKTGIYSIAFFIATVIEIPFRSAVQIAGPILSEALHRNDMQKVDDIYKRNTLTQMIIGGLIMILIWINIDNIFKIMPKGNLFAEGKYVVLFIGLSKLYDISTGLNNHIIIYSKYYRTALIWILGLGVVTIISNLLLIPVLGINGAAIASLISVVLINTIVIIFIYNKLKTQPFSLPCLLAALVLAACYGINLLIPMLSNPWLDASLRSVVTIAIYGFVIYRLKLSSDINGIVDKILKIREMQKFIKGQ